MNIVAVEGAGVLPGAVRAGLAQRGWSVDAPDPVSSASLVVFATDNVSALLQRLGGATAPVIVIVIDVNMNSWMEAHLLIAAVEPLAIKAAPNCRVCAVRVQTNGDQADVAAAVDFLLSAPSVTGQIISIAPRDPASA